MLSHNMNTTFRLRTMQSKQFIELLELTNLTQAALKFQHLFVNAQVNAHNPQRFMQIIHQIWNDPDIVPFLALKHCFKKKQLIVPVWHHPVNVFVRYLDTKSGGQRRLVIATPEQRLAMSIVNSIFQASTYSWTPKTFGFRPGFGTIHAVNVLSDSYIQMLSRPDCNAVLVMFDLQKAYDSVNFSKLVNKLELYRLPLSLKHSIWHWHHPNIFTKMNDNLDGLPQGYNYCPTVFAWYLDKCVLSNMASFLTQQPYSSKPNNIIVYADNFAAVIDKNHLDDFLLFANLCISSEGLHVKPGSFTVVHPNYSKESSISWLGHKLCLKTGSIFVNQSTKNSDSLVQTDKDQKKCFKAFKVMLQTTNWLYQVKSSNWRLTLKS